ncbi:MAG: 3-dehydroquinate synthase [Cyanobacteria bacterium RUI128]|nr:3-dehydroquinate synthase [Cyanobacteria bacterium RUI128]
MTVLTVNIPETESKSYPIYINNDDINQLKSKLDEETQGRKRLVIFSEKVYKIYGKTLNFNKSEIFVLKDGEDKKNLHFFEKIIKKAITLKLSRKDIIVAIGGGVVGDMAGFAAASYMRGIDFIQVPTTLLACVDSSVGGKTAIDMPHGKNYVGAFYQPKAVYINTNFLKTLDDKQYKSGFGEVIKYAFIEKSCNAQENYDLLEILKNNTENFKTRNSDFLSEIIKICLELKSAVVNQDEKEKGLRKILNLGHTFGHALEEETKYKRFTHGYAVILGLMYVFNYALKNNLCERKYYEEAFTLMHIYGYEPPKCWFINKKRTLNYMKTDKKSDGNNVTLILPTTCGEVTEQQVQDISSLGFDVDYLPLS